MTMPIDSNDDLDSELTLYLSAGRNHAQTLKTIRLEFHRFRDIQRRQRRAALHSHHPAAPPPKMGTQSHSTRADRS